MHYSCKTFIHSFIHSTAIHLRPSHLLVALLVQQLAQIVQAGGDGALVGVRVLQVLVRDVGAGQESALGLVQPSLVHQDDPRVQVGRWRRDTSGAVTSRRRARAPASAKRLFDCFTPTCLPGLGFLQT